jgi:carbon monoxide dehydrogenase subunit G
LKLTGELFVAAPLESTWSALLDPPRVASALPGASLDGEPRDGAYRGTVTVELGSVTAEYAGIASLDDVDEDEHVASYHLEARERSGHGAATATITSRLAGEDEGTRLWVETELEISGRQARLGRGVMENVAAGVLDRFARGLEQELAEGAADGVRLEAEPEGTVDAGRPALAPLRQRAAAFAAGLALGLLVGWLADRR